MKKKTKKTRKTRKLSLKEAIGVGRGIHELGPLAGMAAQAVGGALAHKAADSIFGEEDEDGPCEEEEELQELGPLAGMAAQAVGGALAHKAADSIFGEEEEELQELGPLAGMAAQAVGGALATKAADTLFGEEDEDGPYEEEDCGDKEGLDEFLPGIPMAVASMMSSDDKETASQALGEDDDEVMEAMLDFLKPKMEEGLWDSGRSDMSPETLAQIKAYQEKRRKQQQQPQGRPQQQDEGLWNSGRSDMSPETLAQIKAYQEKRRKQQQQPQGRPQQQDEGLWNPNQSDTSPETLAQIKAYQEKRRKQQQQQQQQQQPKKEGIVIESRGRKYLAVPLTEAGGAGQVLKGLMSQAGKVLSQVDPETIAQILQSFTQMAQGILRAKQSMGSRLEDSYIPEGKEDELQRVLSQLNLPPQMSDQEVESLGSKIVDIIKMNRSLSGASWEAGAKDKVGHTPRDPASWRADSQMGRFKSLLNNEGRTVSLTKGQLKTLMVEAIQAHKKKTLVEQITKQIIREQIEVRNLSEYFLTEGPLSAIWKGAKNLGRGLAGGAQAAGRAASSGAQQAMQRGQQQDAMKQAQKMAQDSLKAISKAKDKFTQETLKSSNLLNQYHDAVVNAVNDVLPQLQQSLPDPALGQFQDQLNQSIGQLHYDLTSEKEGLETFLSSLNQASPRSAGKGQTARRQTQDARDDEASQYGQSSVSKLGASPGVRRTRTK